MPSANFLTMRSDLSSSRGAVFITIHCFIPPETVMDESDAVRHAGAKFTDFKRIDMSIPVVLLAECRSAGGREEGPPYPLPSLRA